MTHFHYTLVDFENEITDLIQKLKNSMFSVYDVW